MATDWREKYETILSKAVDGWYVEAFRTPGEMYVYHAPAEYPVWGDVRICPDSPGPKYELSSPERIPYAADKRQVRSILSRLQLPIIGE